MSESGSYQNGVWLSKNEGSRNERYQRWTDGRNRSQVQRLDRQQHSSLVKLSGDCLEVRNELRSLKNTKRQLSLQTGHRHPSSHPTSPTNLSPLASSSSLTLSPSDPSLTATASVAAAGGGGGGASSTTAARGSTGMKKSSSSNSLTSSSSGYGSAVGSPKAVSSSFTSSKTNPTSGMPRRGSAGDFGALGGPAGASGSARGVKAKSLGASSLNADLAALKMKNLHSARALSKLNNNMDV